MYQERKSLHRAYLKDEPELGRRHKGDRWLLIICALLLTIGLTVIYAIGPALSAINNVSSTYFTFKQLLAIGLSVVGFIIAATVPLKYWKIHYKWILGLAIFATLLAVVLPVNPQYPAHRWVRLGGFSFQSVELLKFSIIIWFASFLAVVIKNNQMKEFDKTAKPILIAIVVIGALVAAIQSDLGSMAVIVAIFVSMAFIAGLPMKRVALIGVAIAIGVILMISIFPYRRARLETYLHPQANCQASGYQVCQALIAVGSGGFFGLGLGKSVQAYGYTPEAGNDSIFAIFAETFGFFGCSLLLFFYMALFSRLKDIAQRTSDDFSRLVIVGIIAWIAVQASINIGAMIGILPLKGITLPFISYGGTSVVFVSSLIGVAFQISRYTSYQKIGIRTEADRSKNNEDISSRRRIGGTYNPGARSSFRD